MPDLRSLVLLLGAVVLGACGGSNSPSSSTSTTTPPTTALTSQPATSSVAPAGPFTSAIYKYAVSSKAWTGSPASSAWDGTGSPGDGDPTVDILDGPEGQRAFVYGKPTTSTLPRVVARSRAVGAKIRPDCVKPEATRTTTIDGEPAIVDEIHCPAKTGVFALNAFVIHDGREYVIFTYDQPGDEAGMRAWFGDLLAQLNLGT